MAFSDYAKSRYLKPCDLPANRVRVTISGYETHEMGVPKETKLVAFFEEVQKPFVLSAKCNRDAIANLYGDDEAASLGQPVDLVIREIEFEGHPHTVIRIVAPSGKAARKVPDTTPVSAAEDVPWPKDGEEPSPF
jgi:hypothetical protein